MKFKKLCALFMAAAMTMSMAGGLVQASETETAAETTVTEAAAEETAATEAAAEETAETTGVPKYIFLFIGDGMSYPQVQATNYYLSANAQESEDILTSKNNLTMMNFPVAGSAQTYDSTSFCPDSASTATSISTGHKTYSGTINMDETMTTAYETIAEKLKDQLGYKVGILTSVNLNHATPAAFYAHQASRNSYYEIGLEMVESGFDYFAGGALLQPTGEEEDQQDLYEVAAEAGYTVVKTQAEAEALTAEDGKVVVIDENLADSDAMSYDMDLEEGQWALADYVDKGIEMLSADNEEGFFMMVEGGKIDWACHANDAGSTITDTIALDNAVEKAVEFYNEHPDETLILVTGDHETGGLSIGFAGTDYDTFLTNLNNQKISYAKFDSDYVAGYKENGTDFETVMADVTELFGLTAPAADAEEQTAEMDSADDHKETDASGTLEMTQYEYEKLQAAYEETMARVNEEESEVSQEEYLLYGSYEPLTVTITHILNNKSGIDFSSYAHTGLPVEVFAMGVGQDEFGGYYDNTDIYNKMAALTGVE
ncbi:MAG TPA: alkaline phosphatase [Candidatus Limivivens merdigallinarum]|uniref:Alkaline phosphatase n=1 Tax=Candidatus Limivivens merdigallinarum TaxID=2840859 RepID=A0A9D0ZXQ3_9FIRM|nr:alkaline phosphatase [Candidatus Limivivens merdigallinarum]